MFLKLTLLNNNIECKEIGTVLIDSESIEAVEEYGFNKSKGCRVRLKPIISGFLDDNDRIYRTQTEYDVAESIENIQGLL